MARGVSRARAVRALVSFTTLAITALAPLPMVSGDPPPFEYVGTIDGPDATFDVLEDGRLVAVRGDQILVETAVQSGVYHVAGSLPEHSINEFGASFISVSPDGSRLAIGDGNSNDAMVHLVNVSDLTGGPVTPTSFAQGNFDASWMDGDHLAVSWADPVSFAGRVSALNMNTGESDLLITIDGASSGVTFDARGNLLTGNGFDFVGPATGEVRAFDAGAIADIIHGSGGPLDFSLDGTLVADVLSAGSLRFDTSGHLFAGGGDFVSGDFEYFALLEAVAVDEAINGGGIVEMDDIFTADPDINPFSFYSARFNAITGEWLVVTFGDPTIYRYALIPAPAGIAVMLGGAVLISCGRRRRHAN